MSNIFMEKKKHSDFTWESLGDIEEGRGNLGTEMPVIVYRLFQYTINHILTKEHGQQFSDEKFRAAGLLAGSEFAKNCLDLNQDLNGFIAQLQQVLKDLKIGILRVENFNPSNGDITLTVGEDLDCSGLPITGEVVCTYDEGFISGILETYTGTKYDVKEIDCWSSGDRVCRFRGAVEHEK